MDTNSRMQIADKAMKSFIARYFRDDEDGTGMITGEFYWPRAEIMEVVMDAWDKTKDPYYQELMGKMYRGFVKEFGEDWSNNPFNDDIMWMTIACARFICSRQRSISIWFMTAHGATIWAEACSGESRTRRKTPASTALP